MKKILPVLACAAGLALATTTPAASAPLSANAAVTTDYVFRGISQSGGQAAVQGGLDYDLGAVLPGLAIGTWASSIDFGHATIGDDTPVEWDLYGSYTGSFTDMFGYSIGITTYNYPNAPHAVNYNWAEIWGGLTYNFGFAAVSGKIFYSPDYVNLSDKEVYYTGGLTIPLIDWLALSFNVGRTELDHSVTPIITNYTDWNISLAATLDAYTFTIGYTESDLSKQYKVTSGPFQTNAQYFAMLSFKIP